MPSTPKTPPARHSAQRLPPALYWAAHIAAWLPLLLLVKDGLTGNLSINPIQDATQRLGRGAILLLTAALAITPLETLTGWRALQKLARPIGLYAFAYAALHLLMFIGVDYGFDFSLLWLDIGDKQYIFLGLAAFLILLALAATSFRWWMKRLGKRWKMLHRLVYAAGLIAVLHYALAAKGDLGALQGAVLQPALYGIGITLLLLLRVPPIRRWVSGLRTSGGFHLSVPKGFQEEKNDAKNL